MNIRKELDAFAHDGATLHGSADAAGKLARELVDLGEAKAETRVKGGGADDLPITTGHA